MTFEKEWLLQQPVASEDSPATPLQRSEERPTRRSRSPSWEAGEPPTPVHGDQDAETAPVLAAVAAADAAAAQAATAAAVERLALPRHLFFPCAAAEADFRAFLGRCSWLGELGLLGLQVVGFVAAAGRAAEIRCWPILWRTVLLMLLPSLAQLWLLERRTALYRRHRERLSILLRAPFDLWLVFTQDAPDLGIGGAVIHRRLPHKGKLLLIVLFNLVMAPQLVCLPWLWSFAYGSALLAFWLRQHGAQGPMFVDALVAAYAAPLAALYRREAAERTRWALQRLGHRPPAGGAAGPGPGGGRAAAGARRGVDTARLARRLRTRVDAEPLAPLDLLLPAALAACRACL